MKLDRGLLEYAKRFLNERSPELVHMDELYDVLEKNYEFSEKQLEMHQQMSGQIEPNWMHDLRNLMNPAKGKGSIVNPRHNFWTIARELGAGFDADKMYDSMVKRASLMSRSDQRKSVFRDKDVEFYVVSFSSAEIIIKTTIGQTGRLTKSMVCKHLTHLAECGVIVDTGKLHRYKRNEAAMILLCPNLSIQDGSIVLDDSF